MSKQKVFVVVSTVNDANIPEVDVLKVFSEQKKAHNFAVQKATKIFKEWYELRGKKAEEAKEDSEHGWFEYDLSVGFSDPVQYHSVELGIFKQTIE